MLSVETQLKRILESFSRSSEAVTRLETFQGQATEEIQNWQNMHGTLQAQCKTEIEAISD